MSITKKAISDNAAKYVRNKTLIHFWWKNKLLQPLQSYSSETYKNYNIAYLYVFSAYDQRTLFLTIETHAHPYIARVFIIIRAQK